MLSILNQYDVFLVDAYGVFWDGANFIEGTVDTLKYLVDNGKFVIILSNTTQLSAPAIEKYTKLGLNKGQHYHELITSGEVARKSLEAGLLLEGRKPKKYYSFGTPNHSLFAGLDYQPVALEDAEFIYIGIPQFTNSQKTSLENKYQLYESSLVSNEPLWDTTEVSAFSAMLDELVSASIPILCANPDLMAPEKCKATNSVNFVVRQGAIVKELEGKGAKIYQFGKPYNQVYKFCHDLLPKQLQNSKIAMIGDTMETDILGAHNARAQLNWQVDSILTLTGNAVRTLPNQKDPELVAEHLKMQFKQLKCQPTHIITSMGINGRIFS